MDTFVFIHPCEMGCGLFSVLPSISQSLRKNSLQEEDGDTDSVCNMIIA